MTEADRTAVFAWAAGRLSWERRLRDLEAADVQEEGLAVEAASGAPAWPGKIRQAESSVDLGRGELLGEHFVDGREDPGEVLDLLQRVFVE